MGFLLPLDYPDSALLLAVGIWRAPVLSLAFLYQAGLIAMNREQLSRITLPENVLDAVLAAQSLRTHEAKRRQLQYIGKLMRNIDTAPIAANLDQSRERKARDTATLHRIERCRDRLTDTSEGINALLAEFAAEFPAVAAVDMQPLRVLMRNTRREREHNKPPKSARALFQRLRDIINPS